MNPAVHSRGSGPRVAVPLPFGEPGAATVNLLSITVPVTTMMMTITSVDLESKVRLQKS